MSTTLDRPRWVKTIRFPIFSLRRLLGLCGFGASGWFFVVLIDKQVGGGVFFAATHGDISIGMGFCGIWVFVT